MEVKTNNFRGMQQYLLVVRNHQEDAVFLYSVLDNTVYLSTVSAVDSNESSEVMLVQQARKGLHVSTNPSASSDPKHHMEYRSDQRYSRVPK